MSRVGVIGTNSKVTPSPGYLCYYPCMQNQPDIVLTDRSGKGNNAAFESGLTSAAAFANIGWLTTALNGKYPFLTNAIWNTWNYAAGESLLIHFRVQMSPPAANGRLLGNGENTTLTGINVRVLATGALDWALHSTSASTYTASGTVATGVENSATLMVDGVGKKVWSWFNSTPGTIGSTLAGTAFTAPTYDFRIGGNTPNSGLAAQIRNLHIVKTSLPLKYTTSDEKTRLVAHMNRFPFIPLSNTDWPA